MNRDELMTLREALRWANVSERTFRERYTRLDGRWFGESGAKYVHREDVERIWRHMRPERAA